MTRRSRLPLLILMLSAKLLIAQDAAATRPEMKRTLEALKERQPRLTLPPLTEEEIASGRSTVNNGRMRSLYLPPSWRSFVISGWGGSRAQAGQATTLRSLQSTPDYAFKTQLFWIVSRANDCRYCLGHQELKLRRIGMTDDRIAALDARWESFPVPEQAALNAARALTLAPHEFHEAAVALLREHYKDNEVIDILYTIARYNCVNRWTSATGIPQDRAFGGEERTELNTPTSEEFCELPSTVAPLQVRRRPEWESWDEVERRLSDARQRSPRVALPSAEFAAGVIAADTPGLVPPQWFTALSRLPIAVEAWRQRQALVRDGDISEELRVKIAWVTSRENRAWYAMGHALARFRAAKGDEAELVSLDRLTAAAEPGEASALRFAEKLTSAPFRIQDDDIEGLKAHYSESEIAQIIHLVADANAFDRFTEALSLPLETE